METISTAAIESEAAAMGATSLVPDALEALRLEVLRRRQVSIEEEKRRIRASVAVEGTTNFTVDI